MGCFFITGTDTGVGKTWFTCGLVRAWRGMGHRAIGLKPISSGDRSDAELLREAGDGCLSLDEINPIHLALPAAPLVAARAENRTLDLAGENVRIRQLRSNWTHLAVEGVGGWRVPIAPGYEVRDWARDLGFPVVVVARATLGTINHTQLTVDSIREAGLTCAGVIVNPGPGPHSPDFDLVRRRNLDLLRELLLLPVLDLEGGIESAGKCPVWLGGK
jgi:dethiobiotin synthetase